MTVSQNGKVLTGIGVLVSGHFAALSGMRIGLVTNQQARDLEGRRTIDVLAGAPGAELISIFTPEHGLDALQEGIVNSSRDSKTGLPVYSLYSGSRRPEDFMVAGMDSFVVDLQDAGARFYTYASTMAYVMEEAARRRLKVMVLDRPNPVGPAGVRGPVLEPGLRSFVGYFPMPVQHGMTLGELALMFNAENGIGASLSVIPMSGYRRSLWFDETGLLWRSPSPNLRTPGQAVLYPGVALVEGTNVSVGRGTETPFELVGAPWIEKSALLDYLENRHIPGIAFQSVEFVPAADKFANERCKGVRIELADRNSLDAPALGIEIGSALYRLFPRKFTVDAMLGLLGSTAALAGIKGGEDPAEIVSGWQTSILNFKTMRSKYLLY
jgi:uncharacterized protein YbbC (DUF1343 family)